MSGFFDIYGLSDYRNKEVIDKFLDIFLFRDKVEFRGYEVPTVKDKEEWVEVKSLSEVIEFGVKNKDLGFSCYITDNLKADLKCVILTFTSDRKIVFGISINDVDSKENDNIYRAREIENEMLRELSVKQTSIQFEYPPADNEVEFLQGVELWKDRF